MRLQPDKIRKIGDKEFSFFTAGRRFLPISRVMGVINEFGFRCLHHFRMRLQPDENQKNRQQKVDHFYCSKFTANLTVFCCSKFTANLTVFCSAANLLLT